jgi:hypothetical protein
MVSTYYLLGTHKTTKKERNKQNTLTQNNIPYNTGGNNAT